MSRTDLNRLEWIDTTIWTDIIAAMCVRIPERNVDTIEYIKDKLKTAPKISSENREVDIFINLIGDNSNGEAVITIFGYLKNIDGNDVYIEYKDFIYYLVEDCSFTVFSNAKNIGGYSMSYQAMIKED